MQRINHLTQIGFSTYNVNKINRENCFGVLPVGPVLGGHIHLALLNAHQGGAALPPARLRGLKPPFVLQKPMLRGKPSAATKGHEGGRL